MDIKYTNNVRNTLESHDRENFTCAKFKLWMTIVESGWNVWVASGCGEQDVGVASGSGWNLWVWLLGVVVRRYIDFLILLIPTLFFFTAASLLFVHLKKCFSFSYYIYLMYVL